MSRRAAQQLAAQGASAEEAAAIVAAIARFAADTAVPPRSAPPGGDGWLRAARLEATGAGAEEPGRWGDPHPWGRPRSK